LTEFGELAEGHKYIVEKVEMSENDNFKHKIATRLRKVLLQIDRVENAKDKLKKALGVLKAFSLTLPNDLGEIRLDTEALFGTGDSGNDESDLADLFESVGIGAQENGRAVCLLIDETQYLKERDMAALIAACHRVSQVNCPLVVICAGLPSIAAIAGDAKSYAERLFEFLPIENLRHPEDRLALINPARGKDVVYETAAVDQIIALTEGYPYFIQEFGKHVWDVAPMNPITLTDVHRAVAPTHRSLDESFFKVRYDRATGSEKKMMFAMARLGQGPYAVSEVARQMSIKTTSIGPTRATLIQKGFVYSPEFGKLAFTVPMFEAYLNRMDPEKLGTPKKEEK
jgi:hypothetical protein